MLRCAGAPWIGGGGEQCFLKTNCRDKRAAYMSRNASEGDVFSEPTAGGAEAEATDDAGRTALHVRPHPHLPLLLPI